VLVFGFHEDEAIPVRSVYPRLLLADPIHWSRPLLFPLHFPGRDFRFVFLSLGTHYLPPRALRYQNVCKITHPPRIVARPPCRVADTLHNSGLAFLHRECLSLPRCDCRPHNLPFWFLGPLLSFSDHRIDVFSPSFSLPLCLPRFLQSDPRVSG